MRRTTLLSLVILVAAAILGYGTTDTTTSQSSRGGSTPSAASSSATSVAIVTGQVPASNQFGVRAGELKAVKNPQGSGEFVCVPRTNFQGTTRYFAWFVNNGRAVKLNGATHNLTPQLPFPRDAESAVAGSGLTALEVTSEGLRLCGFN